MRQLVLWTAILAVACAAWAPVPAAYAQDGGGPEAPREVFSASFRKRLARQDRLAQEGDFETLLVEAREGVKEPTADGYYLLGRALGNTALSQRAKGDREAFDEHLAEARAAFAKSKELGGLLYPPAHLGLARCALFGGDLRTAEVELRKALEIEPAFREAVLVLSQILWNGGRPMDAEHLVYEFLQKRPDALDARMQLGQFKLKRKRWEEAEREFATVLQKDPGNTDARKGLGTALMFRRKYREAAEELERVRQESPKSDDVYMALFHIYRQLRDVEQVRKVLEAGIEQLPGTEVGKRCADRLAEIDEDPEAFGRPQQSLEELIAGLDSEDEAVVLRTLNTMQGMTWKLLPAGVYRLLARDAAGPKVRRAAVRLIGNVPEPRTITILEITLNHPRERDPDVRVRQEAARAIAKLPTPATLFILWDALHASDVELREAGVRGIAARTGKWFRKRLEERTGDADWPAELALYERWWKSGSASLRRREAVLALKELYAPIRERRRVARYLLYALDDANPRTWRAAYDLFRSWTFVSFGDVPPTGVSAEERQRIAREAREWMDADDARRAAGAEEAE